MSQLAKTSDLSRIKEEVEASLKQSTSDARVHVQNEVAALEKKIEKVESSWAEWSEKQE